MLSTTTLPIPRKPCRPSTTIGMPTLLMKLIDNNGDGKVDSMIVTPMTVAEVTYVGSTSITAGNKSYKFEDDDIYEGVAKNDWAVIVAGDYTTTDNAVITKAGTIEDRCSHWFSR